MKTHDVAQAALSLPLQSHEETPPEYTLSASGTPKAVFME